MSPLSIHYLTYIHSDQWHVRRQRALKLAGNRCQVCGESRGLQVHHVSYEHLGQEADADLTVMCWYCHQWITMAIRMRRAWRWLISWIKRILRKQRKSSHSS